MSATALGHAWAPMIYIVFMVGLGFGGLPLSALLDPTRWVPRRSGIGWTIDFGHPHVPRVL
jgi:hypothetical protein